MEANGGGEARAQALARLAAFRAELDQKKLTEQTAIHQLEQQIDQTTLVQNSRENLEKLAQIVQSLSYLLSLERDVDRMKKRFLSEPS
jgi:hypothetical protein